jgi:hypothetical protein
MKLLLMMLFLSSCALTPEAPKKPCNCKKERTHTAKMYICMKEFSDKGFDSDALVKICQTIHQRRK